MSGFHPSTLHGADIIAAQGFLVVVPDFFKGKPLAQENYPPDTPEKEKIVQAFFAGPASPPDNLKLLSSFATAASKEFPQVTGHGILGYCWGGKIAVLASGQRDVFEATAVVHPAMLQADDATSLTAPIMLLASKDEDAKEVKAFEAAVPKGAVKDASHFETYTNMHHGWAAARADLSTQEKKDVYSETYEKLSGFFTKNIKE